MVTGLSVMSIPPNWKAQFALLENFGGLVIEALSTAEQRLGTAPRSRFGFKFETLTLTAQESGYLRKALENPVEQPFAVPFWPDKRKLTIAPSAGTAWVDCDSTVATMFDQFEYVMLWHDFDSFELFRRFAVSANQIQFDRPILGTFAVNDFVVPVALGSLKRPATAAATDVNAVFRVDFTGQFIQVPVFLETQLTNGADLDDYRDIDLVGVGGPAL